MYFNELKEIIKKSKNLFEKYEKNKFFLAFSIIFILFSFSLLIFKSTWGINDDVLMAMDVYGKGFSSEPTEYIFFSNIIIGSILKKIYQTVPTYPWYGFYTFFILFISFVALLYSLLNHKYSKTRIGYFFLYFILFGLWLIRMPQFTTNAFLVGMSGIFLLLSGINKGKTTVLSNIILVASILFLTLSSLIRMDSFYLVIVLSLPLILTEIIKNDSKKQIIKKIFVFFIFLCIIIGMCNAYNNASYFKDDSWVYLSKKQKLRVDIIDNNKVTEYSSRTKHIFDKVGWSLNDFILLKDWFAADDHVFSMAKMEKILTDFKYVPAQKPTIFFESMYQDKYFYGAIVLMIFFVLQVKKEKKNIIQITLSVLLSISIIIYLGYYVRLPQRIYMSVLAFLSFLMLFFTDKNIELPSIKKSEKFKFLFLVLFIMVFLFVHSMFNTVRERQNIMFKSYIAQLHAFKGHILLVWSESLPLELIAIFDRLDDFSGIRMFNIASDLKEPKGMKIAEEFNVKTFEELIGKENLFHIGNMTYMALYARYLKEHYNMDVAFKIHLMNQLFMVYKQIEINPDIIEKVTPVIVNIGNFKYTIFIVKE